MDFSLLLAKFCKPGNEWETSQIKEDVRKKRRFDGFS